MFKVLVLQTLYTLSDDATEYQLKDRLPFMRYNTEHQLYPARDAGMGEAAGHCNSAFEIGSTHTAPTASGDRPARITDRSKIGRASCRERV